MSDQEATLEEFADDSEPVSSDPSVKNTRESQFWGAMPDGWELVDGSGIYEVNPNPTPDEEPNTYIEMDALDTELPWPEYFGERSASEYSGKTFTSGDTLLARITPCTENGKAALVPEMETRVGIGSTEFAVLSPNRDRVLPWYLFYVAKSHPVHDYAISRMRGSTGRQRVPFSVFRHELDIALPPREEQRKIASVLYTLDQAIQKTEEIIAQRERSKTGLMQDIFQAGIGPDGKLHQSEQDSSAFRKTKYGTIPEEWKIVPLNQIVPDDAPVVYGILKPGDHQPDGVPVVKVKDIHDGEIKQGDLLHTAPEIHEDYKRAELREGDLLFTIRGTVGRMAFVPESLDGANITQDTARIRIEGANPRFVRYYFETATPNNYFERNTIGQAVQGINLEKLREVPVHLPSEEEQERIVNILDSHSDQTQKERQYLDRLNRLKNGLMQDLLSGEVRTREKDVEVVDEVLQHG